MNQDSKTAPFNCAADGIVLCVSVRVLLVVFFLFEPQSVRALLHGVK